MYTDDLKQRMERERLEREKKEKEKKEKERIEKEKKEKEKRLKEEANSKAEREIREKKYELERIENDIKQEEQGKVEDERDIQRNNQERARLVRDIQTLERELEEARKKQNLERAKHQQHGKELFNELTTVDNELQHLNHTHLTQKRAYEELVGFVSRAEQTLNEGKSRMLQLEHSTAAYKAGISGVEKDIRTTENRIRQLEIELNRERDKLAKYERTLMDHRNESHRLDRELSTHKAEITKVETEYNAKKHARDQLHQDLMQLEAKINTDTQKKYATKLSITSKDRETIYSANTNASISQDELKLHQKKQEVQTIEGKVVAAGHHMRQAEANIHKLTLLKTKLESEIRALERKMHSSY